jgi:DNA-binding transcriptional ArsR family regulator
MKTLKAEPFQAIADPNRRQILRLLTRERLTINSLAENFKMSRPAVSKHIKILYSAGFISIEDVGRERYCQLNQKGFNELQQWINYFDSFWENNLMKLGKLMDQKSKRNKK